MNTELIEKTKEISFYYKRLIKNVASLCKTYNTRSVVHQHSIFTKSNITVKEMDWINAQHYVCQFCYK